MSLSRHRREADEDLREEGDSDNPLPEAGRLENSEESSETSSKMPLLADDNEKKQASLKQEVAPQVGAKQLILCFVGLQASYLTWGYVQEKVMTREYTTGKFPSATFAVFSNRALAVLVAMIITMVQHKGQLGLPAPYYVFAPCALSNSLSSFGQYQALRYVSFPLQTISKSTKVIPVMLMGKVLNKKSYPAVDYLEAVAISMGVSIFSLASDGGASASDDPTHRDGALLGVCMLALYVVSDSFTSQWQTRVYQSHPGVDQFQMMWAVNSWAILMTLFALVTSGELLLTLRFLRDNPSAAIDNVTIAITSATGQLFIFYTIKTFGPVVFTIIMTTRQVFSIAISVILFGHSISLAALFGAMAVFGSIFHRVRRQAKAAQERKAQQAKLAVSSSAGSSKISINGKS